MNVTILSGTLSRPPELRETAAGASILSLDVTTVRDDGPSDTVPVSWFDPPASAAKLSEGDDVIVTGRVRRRFFRAGGRTQSRTDVVAEAVFRSTARVRAARAIDEAIGRVHAVP